MSEQMELVQDEFGRWRLPMRPRQRRPPRPKPRPVRSRQRRFGVPVEPASDEPTSDGNERVRWIQNSLNRILGLQLPMNGVMSRETRSAIRSFQERQGLPADGIAGPDTERALMAARGARQLESQAVGVSELEMQGEVNHTSAANIRRVQQSLNQSMGLRLPVHGILDVQTRSAIRSYQRRRGFSVVGVAHELEEGEFRKSALPASVQYAYDLGGPMWPAAVQRAIDAGIRDLNQLTNIVFFMHHPERMKGGIGKPLHSNEPGYLKLVDEWKVWRDLVKPILAHAPASKPLAKPTPARTAVREVRLHLYLPLPQAKTDYVNYLDYSWDKTSVGPFSAFGVTLTLITDEKKGIEDLKKSLDMDGTIVVYMGHTSLVEVKKKTFVAQGLAPQSAMKPFLKNAALVALLEKAKANIVILAGCATDASVPKRLKNDVIVITTASGRDGVTHSAFWARALTGFLLALVGWDFDGKTVTQRTGGTATVNEAIAVGNKFFPKGDSFVLASGDGSIKEF